MRLCRVWVPNTHTSHVWLSLSLTLSPSIHSPSFHLPWELISSRPRGYWFMAETNRGRTLVPLILSSAMDGCHAKDTKYEDLTREYIFSPWFLVLGKKSYEFRWHERLAAFSTEWLTEIGQEKKIALEIALLPRIEGGGNWRVFFPSLSCFLTSFLFLEEKKSLRGERASVHFVKRDRSNRRGFNKWTY